MPFLQLNLIDFCDYIFLSKIEFDLLWKWITKIYNSDSGFKLN